MKSLILKYHFLILILFFQVAIGTEAYATPNAITFQSKIYKPDGFALESAAVTFRLSLTDSLGTCVIYQEDFANQNMTGTKGLINLSLGGGTQTFPAPAMTMSEAFNNYNSPTLNCQSGGSITPSATDVRKLIVQFNDGSGWQTVPAMTINAVPTALQSISSQKLGDYPATDYVRLANVATCGGGQALHFNGTTFTCVAAGGAGAGTVTSVTSANADINVATTTTTPVLTLNAATTGADKILRLKNDGSLDAISGANLTNLNASALASGTVPAARMPALTGAVTTVAGSTATSIAAGVIINANIDASAAIARSKIAASTVGERGDVLINDGAGNISSLQCANGEVIKFDASGVAICGTDNGGAGGFADGGNTFFATATIGTNSNHNLEIETNGSTKMTVLAGGNVGIGTNSPNAKLEVVGNVNFGSQTTRTTTANRGQLASGSTYLQTVNASTTVDWNDGNVQEIATFVCDGAKTITFNNMKDGGVYSILISGNGAHTGACLFVAGGFSFLTSGGPVAPTSGAETLFTFSVIGTKVIYTMTDNLF